MESMTDILAEKEPEKPVEEVKTEPEAPQEPVEVEKVQSRRKQHMAKEYEAQGRDPETGQFIQKEEKPEVKEEVKAEVKPEVKLEPKKEELTEKERGFLRGLEEERRKRQELERRIAEMQTKQPEGEKKTFWDDPEGHFKTIEQRQAQRETAFTLKVSETIARSKYTDFDGAIEVFADILKTPAGPGVHAQFLAAQDPAEFAYRLGKQTKE